MTHRQFRTALIATIIIVVVAISYSQSINIHIGEATHSFDLAQVDSITFADPPRISVDQEALEFNPVPPGISRTLDLTISNDGQAQLSIDSIRTTDIAFSLDLVDATPVQSQQSVSIPIIFPPPEIGEFNADLIIFSSDPENAELRVRLSGSGLIHFDFDSTDSFMSVLIVEALIDAETLLPGDEISVFTSNGLCAGRCIINPEFPDEAVGLRAFGADPDMDNGFQQEEEMTFRFWDSSAQREYLADHEVCNCNQDGIWIRGGFVVHQLSATSE